MQKWIDPSSTIWSYSMSSGVLLIQELKPDEFLFVTLSKVKTLCVQPDVTRHLVLIISFALPGLLHGVMNNVDVLRLGFVPVFSLESIKCSIRIVDKANLVPIVLVNLIEESLIRHDEIELNSAVQ